MFKFKNDIENSEFTWEAIGDIEAGRPNLGGTMPVSVYRLFQFTMRYVLNSKYGAEATAEIFRESGLIAGREFCRNVLDKSLDFDGFIAELQKKLQELGIGILVMEKADIENLEFTITVAEDLDCSGLPITEESVCDYDEGFIAGIMQEYSGKEFRAKEIDCWATGDRVCRFKVDINK